MIEKKYTGELYFHVFKKKDGTIVHTKTTEEDYKQLGAKNPTNPTALGCVWLYSYSCHGYDTPTGLLEDNQYAVVGEDVFVKMPDMKGFHVSSKDFIDGSVMADELTRLKALPFLKLAENKNGY